MDDLALRYRACAGIGMAWPSHAMAEEMQMEYLQMDGLFWYCICKGGAELSGNGRPDIDGNDGVTERRADCSLKYWILHCICIHELDKNQVIPYDR